MYTPNYVKLNQNSWNDVMSLVMCVYTCCNRQIVMRPDSGSESENDHNVASKIPEEVLQNHNLCQYH